MDLDWFYSQSQNSLTALRIQLDVNARKTRGLIGQIRRFNFESMTKGQAAVYSDIIYEAKEQNLSSDTVKKLGKSLVEIAKTHLINEFHKLDESEKVSTTFEDFLAKCDQEIIALLDKN